jgi:hypothetical protein
MLEPPSPKYSWKKSHFMGSPGEKSTSHTNLWNRLTYGEGGRHLFFVLACQLVLQSGWIELVIIQFWVRIFLQRSVSAQVIEGVHGQKAGPKAVQVSGKRRAQRRDLLLSHP